MNPKCREEVQMVRDKGTAALHRHRLLLPSFSFIFIPRLHRNFLLIILHLRMPSEQLVVKLHS